MDATNKLLIAYRRNREKGEVCMNKGCEHDSKQIGTVKRSLYLNRVHGKEKWICHHCAKFVDKLI